MMNKYAVGGSQTQYQPGSNEQVLLNKLSIIDSDEMNEAELVLLDKLYHSVLNKYLSTKSLSCNDLRDWHRRWLGNIYSWAGQERTVNMSKDGFTFAAAGRVSALMQQFELKYLAKYTPCTDMNDTSLIEAIAEVHVEFILIHPFREGNGRLARLLADVMAVQAGHEPLDYSWWNTNKSEYFIAIQQGLNCNYNPMKALVAKALR